MPKQLTRHDYIRRIGADDETDSEEFFAPGRYFDANCPAALAVGDFVYITGVSVGGVFQVDRAEPKSPGTANAKMPSLGVVLSKASSTDCLVHGGVGIVSSTVLGVILSPESRYFVGFNGRVSSSIPIPDPSGFALVQVVGVALDTSRLLLAPNFHLVRRRG